jgi:hypothetical protein
MPAARPPRRRLRADARLLVAGRAPAGTAGRRLVLRIEYRDGIGPWFPWLPLSVAAMATVASSAGWRVETVVETGPRYLACLRRGDRSPCGRRGLTSGI